VFTEIDYEMSEGPFGLSEDGRW
jgi:hypothetical protein